jgi:hypothetical protein
MVTIHASSDGLYGFWLRRLPCRRRRIYEGAFWLGSPVLLGLLLGSLLPTNHQGPAMPEPLDRISSIIGWVRAAEPLLRQPAASPECGGVLANFWR